MKYILWVLFIAVTVLLGDRVSAAMIQDIRMASRSADTVRIVVDLSDKAEAVVFRLKSPERLVLDFKKTSFNQENKARTLPTTGFIKGARTGVPNANTARIVIDLPPEQLTEKHFPFSSAAFIPSTAGIPIRAAPAVWVPTTSATAVRSTPVPACTCP